MKRLYDIAFGRSGDKGNIANISVIARSPEAYQEIKGVKHHFDDKEVLQEAFAKVWSK